MPFQKPITAARSSSVLPSPYEPGNGTIGKLVPERGGMDAGQENQNMSAKTLERTLISFGVKW